VANDFGLLVVVDTEDEGRMNVSSSECDEVELLVKLIFFVDTSTNHNSATE